MKTTRNDLFAAALGAAALLFAYSNSLHNVFHYDDLHVIVNNVYIRSLHNAPLFFRDAYTFSSIPEHATYRPLVTLTYAIDYAIAGGLDPVQFHVTQILLLLVIWGMLIVFFRKALDVFRPSPRNRWIALISATVWAIHTVNTETLNLISARSEELAAMATLAALLLVQFSPFARRWHLYIVPIAIGAMAKAQIVIFALLLLPYLVFIEGKSVRKKATWLAILPPVLAGIALLLLLNLANAPEFVPGGTSRWRYFLTQGLAWAHYTRLFFLPVGLTVDTDWKALEHWYDPWALGGFAFVILLLLLIRYVSRRSELRPVAFGLSWFAVALVPTSSIYPLAEVVNEHRVFLPYMGLALAAVFWLDAALEQHRRVFSTIALAAIIALGAGTMVRNEVWATEETLWKDTASKSPGNERALLNYGSLELAKGNYAVAKPVLERAEALNANYPMLEVTLGILEGQLKNDVAAEQHFQRARLMLPNSVDTHFYYADWLVRDGRAMAAIPELRLAMGLSPARTESRSLLMKLYAAKSDTGSLQQLAAEARSYDTTNADAAAVLSGSVPGSNPGRNYEECFRTGREAIGSGRFLDAALANREAIRFEPAAADAWINLGWSLAQIGLDREAEQAFERSLVLRPGDEHALSNLAWLRSGKGNDKR
jgi:protein O-mannosyl-transferase